jgi:hypothetical protein
MLTGHTTDPQATPSPTTPRCPTLTALGFLCCWIAVLSLPMWTGQYVAGPHSDQFDTGVRHWSAEQWRATGHLPLWNPEILGGVPSAAGSGDLFYPTALLRLFLPTIPAINLAFIIHYVLAGFFLYVFLRLLGTSWLGSVIGATAYQLSGAVISYVSPGHDGKLFVTALFPLMLIGLVLGIRRRRLEGHALLGVAVGLAILSPQYQVAQYALLAAGLFALYLAFGEPGTITVRQGWSGLALALASVLLGFGISLIQVLPFLHFIPFSPRAGVRGFEWSTSYAVPWIHLVESFVSGFTGTTQDGTYWGTNPLKLHSEYLGLPVLGLAILGIRSSRRRLVHWITGIGLLFLLVALGDGTPFYRLWWGLVPYVNKTRAPGMAFYLVGFATAVLAGFGTERLERGEGKHWAPAALIVGGLLALLSLSGTFGMIATSYARDHEGQVGISLVPIAARAQSDIMFGALESGIGLVLMASLVLLFLKGKLRARAFSVALLILIGGDLWRAGRGFWHWSRPETEQMAADDLIRRVKETPQPYRLYDYMGVYPNNALMAHGIAQVGGYHGNALQTYLDLVGGWQQQQNLRHNLNLWKLLAVRFVVFPDTVRVPGFHQALGPVYTGLGRQVYLYEADSIPDYARVVPTAVKADASQIVPTLMDQRMDYDRLVLFTPDQPVNPPNVTEMPAPSSSRAIVRAWKPGQITITLNPAPVTASYVVVSENWYKDWRATVDGDAAIVIRGNQSLISVPVRAASQTVELSFQPSDYKIGKLLTMVSLMVLVGMAVAPLALRRWRYVQAPATSSD